jgi:prepilin-type N-terminal cleavage/methylation domain-containing protein
MNKKGFTLTEVITVLIILAILVAAAVPAMLGIIEAGHQKNRMNIARTLYIAANDRLSELRLHKNLKAQVTGEFYEIIDGEYIIMDSARLLAMPSNVYTQSGSLPTDEINNENQDYVHYISKSAGDPFDNCPVVQLLQHSVWDYEVLRGAILIEYNIKTAKVLSVYYSNVLSEGESLGYSETVEKRNVSGRGDDDYPHAQSRQQGFYITTTTGSVPTPTIKTIELHDSILDNMLYAEMIIPEIYTHSLSQLLLDGTVVFSGSLHDYDFVYREDSGEIPAGHVRLIWVIDRVGGDISRSNENSIARYGDFDISRNITAGMTVGGTMIESNSAHPYFMSYDSDGDCAMIRSARHLYNVRYFPDYNFTQIADIDMKSIDNFQPIEHFSGEYYGGGFVTDNLTIDVDTDYVGLFSQVGDSGEITAVTLTNANISGGEFTGAIAGINHGLIEECMVKYSRIHDGEIVGGIVGENFGAVKNVSFISMNTPDEPPVSGKNAGGIAGNNQGDISFCLYIAPAPIVESVAYPIIFEGADVLDCAYLSGLLLHNGDYIEYNRGSIDNNGNGFFTDEFNLSNLNFTDFDGNVWGESDCEYPYPHLSKLPAPEKWQVTSEFEETPTVCEICLNDPCICSAIIIDEGIDIYFQSGSYNPADWRNVPITILNNTGAALELPWSFIVDFFPPIRVQGVDNITGATAIRYDMNGVQASGNILTSFIRITGTAPILPGGRINFVIRFQPQADQNQVAEFISGLPSQP